MTKFALSCIVKVSLCCWLCLAGCGRTPNTETTQTGELIPSPSLEVTANEPVSHQDAELTEVRAALTAARQSWDGNTVDEVPSVERLLEIMDPTAPGVHPEILRYQSITLQVGATKLLAKHGRAAEPAFETLLKLAERRDHGSCADVAAHTICAIDAPEIVPRLIEYLNNNWFQTSPQVKGTLQRVGVNHPDCLFDVIERKLPVLPEVRMEVLLTASRLGSQAEKLLPELLEVLRSPAMKYYHARAATAVGQIGIRTDEVVTVLDRVIRENGQQSRQPGSIAHAAFETLRQLDPEAAVNSTFLNDR